LSPFYDNNFITQYFTYDFDDKLSERAKSLIIRSKNETTHEDCDIHVALVAAFQNIEFCLDSGTQFIKGFLDFKTSNSKFYNKILSQFKQVIQPVEILDDITDDVIPERWFYIIIEVLLKLAKESVVFFLHQLVIK
jgi:hypothetical protein